MHKFQRTKSDLGTPLQEEKGYKLKRISMLNNKNVDETNSCIPYHMDPITMDVLLLNSERPRNVQ